mgnify:FL=1
MRILMLISALLVSSLSYANQQLICQWQGQIDGQSLVIQFNADGTGQIAQQPIYYQIQNNQLLIPASD